ncbi:PKD domain-containing protein [Streptomyces cyaneus]|uniref:PKD domain-containing protein n=1 Tax=Streptomyces cyaneus TaxID=1904 RepID=UPI000FF8B00A|nr:PKD domain-containing protein [Streptomyces cyaneus]
MRADERYAVWVPLVQHADLDQSRWAEGPNWAGSPPPPWPNSAGTPTVPPSLGTLDEGFNRSGTGAVGFRVDRLRLFQDVKPGNDFVFSVVAPDGTLIGTEPSAVGWTNWLTVPASVVDGAGFWTVVIDRAVGSSVHAPALLPAPGSPGNTVGEPYVSPYGDLHEGILGVQFEGSEIFGSPHSTATAATVVGDCSDGVRGTSTLRIDFTPPLPVGTTYAVTWYLGTKPPLSTGNLTVAGTPLPSVETTTAYTPGTYHPGAAVTVTPPGVPTQTFNLVFSTGPAGGVVVAPCPAGICHDLKLTANPASPCSSGGAAVLVDITAVFAPATPSFTGPVAWQVRDAVTNTLLPFPPNAPPPTGPTLNYRFPSKGRYEVTASIERPPGCSPRTAHKTLALTIGDCDCAVFIGDLTATRVNGCTFSFAAPVRPSPTGAALTFIWDFGSGPDPNAPNSPVATHTYAPGSTGSQTVRLTVTSPGCSDTVTTTIDVDCRSGPLRCPEPSGAITATETSACVFDFALPVHNPDSRPIKVTWDFGDGSTSVGTAVSHSFTSSGPFTVTATLSSEDCPDRTTSTTVNCTPGSGPPPAGGGCACDVLLWIALGLTVVAAVFTAVAVCAKVPYLGFVAGGAMLLAVFVYLLWAGFCARIMPNACQLLHVLECILDWVIAVVVPLAALLIGLFTADVMCGLAVAATDIEFGILLILVHETRKALKCPPGPSCFGIPAVPGRP